MRGLLAIFATIAANKYERERDEANERAKAIASTIGCGIIATVKECSDDRWRISVGRLDPSQETDADWISTGDGYETSQEAKAVVRLYWPDGAIVVIHADEEASDGRN